MHDLVATQWKLKHHQLSCIPTLATCIPANGKLRTIVTKFYIPLVLSCYPLLQSYIPPLVLICVPIVAKLYTSLVLSLPTHGF
jgi:hypothetical protein